MAIYQTDYSGYTTGAQPGDWTLRWDSPGTDWPVQGDAGAIGGKRLRSNSVSGTNRHLISWDAVDGDANRADVELLVKFRTSTTTGNHTYAAIARASGGSGAANGYVIDAGASSSTFAIARLNNHSYTSLATAGASLSTNTWYWVRFRLEGTSLKAKLWADDPWVGPWNEPAGWQIEVTDSGSGSISDAGWVGVGRRASTGTRDFDFVVVATNGETATPDWDPGELRFYHAPLEVLLSGDAAARLYQAPLEILVTTAPAEQPSELQLYQAPLEVLVTQPDSDAQLYHAPLEILVVSGQTGPCGTGPCAEPGEPLVYPITLPGQPVYREYQAFLRFTAGETSYAFGTTAEVRSGLWHEGLISRFPEPTDMFRDEFGLSGEDRLDVEISDPDNIYLDIDLLRGIEADLELVTVHVAADGTRTELPYQRRVVIESVGRQPGVLTLELIDLDRSALEAEYPPHRYSDEDWPELYVDDIGLPISTVVGLGSKVPFARIQHGAGSGPWVYAGPAILCEIHVLTVYRDGMVVDPDEYEVGKIVTEKGHLLVLRFAQEQVDFSGRQMAITADCWGAVDYRNSVAEIKRLLDYAGIPVDRASFCSAAQYADDEAMFIDIGYVQPRTLRAILLDLLFLARAHLYRAHTGDWVIVQDRPKAAVLALDEAARDALEVTEYKKGSRVKTLKLDFRTHSAPNLYDLQYTLKRTTGAQTGEHKTLLPYVWDGTVADRLHSYLAQKEDARAEARAIVHDVQLPLGSVIELANPLLWSGEKPFIVEEVRRGADVNELRLREYVASIYTYLPGDVPPNTGNGSSGFIGTGPGGYNPDFSKTPPAAPSGLEVVSQDTTLDQDGKAQAWVKLKATPPETNWSAMRFAVKADDTGEILLGQAEDAGDGTYTATLPGLRLARGYVAMSWAVNSNAVEGHAALLAFTSAGWELLPAAPATITATQGIGRSVTVAWSEVSGSQIRYYELQRNTVTITKTDALEEVDLGVSYGVSYTYRVRAVDRSGNASAWTTAAPVTPVKNIAQPDLTDGSVGSGQLIDLNVTNPKIGEAAVSTEKIEVNAVSNLITVTAADVNVPSGGAWVPLVSNTVDVEGGGFTALCVFTAYAVQVYDTWGRARVRVNGTLRVSQKFGILTSDGNSKFALPVSIVYNGEGFTSANIEVEVASEDNLTGDYHPYVAQNITLTILGAKR